MRAIALKCWMISLAITAVGLAAERAAEASRDLDAKGAERARLRLNPVFAADLDTGLPRGLTVVGAPIHPEAISGRLVLKSKWPEQYARPQIVTRHLRLAWRGPVAKSGGEEHPLLIAGFEIALPAGATMAGQSEEELRPKPPAQNPNSSLDLFVVHVGVGKLTGNEATFFVRLPDNSHSEIAIQFDLALKESPVWLDDSCARERVSFEESESSAASYFLFARCFRSGRRISLIVHKPADVALEVRSPESDLVQATDGQPVLHFLLPDLAPGVIRPMFRLILKDTRARRALIEFRVGAIGQSSRSQLWVGGGLAVAAHSEAGTTSAQAGLELRALGRYGFSPRWLVGELGASFTALPVLLTSTREHSVRYLRSELRFLFESELEQKPFTFSLGPSYFVMHSFVAGKTYGFSPIVGPGIFARLSHHPYDQTGWQLWLKYHFLFGGEHGELFRSISDRRSALGGAVDWWWSRAITRPRFVIESSYVENAIFTAKLQSFVTEVAVEWPLL